MTSKLFIALIIQVVFLKLCYGQNKTDNWNAVRVILMSKSDTLFSDNVSKKKFTNCVIEKLNANYPNGQGGMSQLDINRIGQEYGAICVNELKGELHFNLSWSGPVAVNFKKMLLVSDLVKNIPENKKSDFCDCFILKLKIKYPNGLTQTIPPAFRDSVYNESNNL